MRSLLASIGLFVLASCGATAPFPSASVWPFGDANVITAERQASAETLSAVGLPERLVLSRGVSDSDISIYWLDSGIGEKFGPLEIAFISVPNENTAKLWAVFIKDPETGEVAKSYVGLMLAQDFDPDTYAIQLFNCEEISQGLAPQCVFANSTNVISAAR